MPLNESQVTTLKAETTMPLSKFPITPWGDLKRPYIGSAESPLRGYLDIGATSTSKKIYFAVTALAQFLGRFRPFSFTFHDKEELTICRLLKTASELL
jgi:hypothetical protein